MFTLKRRWNVRCHTWSIWSILTCFTYHLTSWQLQTAKTFKRYVKTIVLVFGTAADCNNTLLQTHIKPHLSGIVDKGVCQRNLHKCGCKYEKVYVGHSRVTLLHNITHLDRERLFVKLCSTLCTQCYHKLSNCTPGSSCHHGYAGGNTQYKEACRVSLHSDHHLTCLMKNSLLWTTIEDSSRVSTGKVQK